MRCGPLLGYTSYEYINHFLWGSGIVGLLSAGLESSVDVVAFA